MRRKRGLRKKEFAKQLLFKLNRIYFLFMVSTLFFFCFSRPISFQYSLLMCIRGSEGRTRHGGSHCCVYEIVNYEVTHGQPYHVCVALCA